MTRFAVSLRALLLEKTIGFVRLSRTVEQADQLAHGIPIACLDTFSQHTFDLGGAPGRLQYRFTGSAG